MPQTGMRSAYEYVCIYIWEDFYIQGTSSLWLWFHPSSNSFIHCWNPLPPEWSLQMFYLAYWKSEYQKWCLQSTSKNFVHISMNCLEQTGRRESSSKLIHQLKFSNYGRSNDILVKKSELLVNTTRNPSKAKYTRMNRKAKYETLKKPIKFFCATTETRDNQTTELTVLLHWRKEENQIHNSESVPSFRSQDFAGLSIYQSSKHRDTCYLTYCSCILISQTVTGRAFFLPCFSWPLTNGE